MAFSYTQVARFTTSILLATRLQSEGNKEQGKYVYQYCFPFPSLATRIVEEVFRLGNTLNERRKYISFYSAPTHDVTEIAQIVKFANTLAHLWRCNEENTYLSARPPLLM